MDFPNTSLDLTFSASSATQTVMVSILNDDVPEDMLEYFSLYLKSTDLAVSLNPMIANITIIDDSDSKYYEMSTINSIHLYTVGQIVIFSSAVVTIGFNTVAYTLLEDAGSINVTVSVVNGTLARNVVVTLSTESDGTATGEFNVF